MPEVAEQQQEQQQVEQQEAAKNYSQADLDRITAKVRKNAQSETEARVRREYAQRTGQQQEQRKEPEKVAELKAPDRNQEPWASMPYEDFLRADAKYHGEKAAEDHYQKRSKEETERKASAAREERDREFGKRAKVVMAEVADFAETIEQADGVMISESMGDVIKESPVGPRILYQLVKDANNGGDLAERISKMTPTAAAKEIGKIEAKIEAEIEAKKKAKPDEEGEEDEQKQEGKQEEERSEQRGEQEDPDRSNDGRFKAQEKGTRKAPEPIDPGTGRSANQDRGPTDKDSDKGWYAKRLAEERAERERKRK